MAPASQVPSAGLEFAVSLLSDWGLRLQLGPNARTEHGFLSATDDARIHEFQAAWDDPEVRAIFCLRGGYGSQRIVDRIRWHGSETSKVLVGFSDITALHLALWKASGSYSLHGPCVGASASGLSKESATSLHEALSNGQGYVLSTLPSEPTYSLTHGHGRVSGPLLGGNLTSVATSVGTSSCPDFSGAVLLLEEVAESPYRVDRLLTYLDRHGVFERTVAVAIGQFINCVSRDNRGPTVVEVLADRFASYGVPTLGGLPVGHGRHAQTLRLGQSSTLDLDHGRLSMGSVAHHG